MQKIVIFLSAVTRLDFQSIVIDVDCVNVKIARSLKFQKIFCLKNAATNNGDMLLILSMIFLKFLTFLLIFLLIINLSVKRLKIKILFFMPKRRIRLY